MSFFDDYCQDPYEDEQYYPSKPKSVTCNRCGAKGLYWKELAAGWRLFKGGEQHVCRPTAKGEFACLPIPPKPEPPPPPPKPREYIERTNWMDEFIWQATGKCRRKKNGN